MRMRHWALLGTTALAGCAQPALSVQQQWGRTISQFDLIPLYPMQEDVQPGDVFLLSSDDAGWMIRVGSLPGRQLLNALCNGYSNRLRIQPMTLPPASDPGNSSQGQPAAAQNAGAAGAPAQAAAAPTPVGVARTPAAGAAAGAPASGKTAGATAAPATAGAASGAKAATVQQGSPAAEPTTTACPADPANDNPSDGPTPSAQALAAAPPTATAIPPKTAPKNPPVAEYDIGALTNTDAALRMHAISLPALKVATYTSADLAGGGSVGSGVTLGGALGGNSQAAVDVTVDDVEEMHIPAADVLYAIANHQVQFLQQHLPPSSLISLLAQRGRQYVKDFCATDFAKLDDVSLLVVNETVYAHKIDFSYASGSTFAGQIAAKLGAAVGTSGTGMGSTGNTGSNNGTQNQSSPTPAQQLQATQQLLQAASNQFTATSPGVQAQFGISKTGNLTLSKTTAQPMALGFAGSSRFTPGDLAATYQLIYADPGDFPVMPSEYQYRINLDATYTFVKGSCQYYGADPGPLLAYLTHAGVKPVSFSQGPKPFSRTTTFR